MTVLRIVLFAGERVGREVAEFMARSANPPVAVVVDSKDKGGLNQDILERARVSPDVVFSSEELKSPVGLDRLRNLNVDLGILAWWPNIIRQSLIEIPRLGFLNFHPSYLPYNRGKHYNFWAIVEGAPFGVTLHWVTNRVDAGDIAFQARVPVTWEDSGETLYHKAQAAIVSLFKEAYAQILSGRIPRIPQDLEEGSFHLASELEEAARIDLDRTYTGRELLNLLRAKTFPPHGGAWFLDDGQRFEVQIRISRTEQR